jgi:hypothetical protein
MPRSRNRAPRRIVLALFVCSVVPLLAACPKKETPQVDAAPPPPPVEDVQTNLVPMEEDAGEVADADADAPAKKYTGPAVNTNVARLKQCCAALSAEAKRMGSSPEAGMFTTAAAQCSQLATQIGPSGNAPELGAIRGLLVGRNVPAVCAGF